MERRVLFSLLLSVSSNIKTEHVLEAVVFKLFMLLKGAVKMSSFVVVTDNLNVDWTK